MSAIAHTFTETAVLDLEGECGLAGQGVCHRLWATWSFPDRAG